MQQKKMAAPCRRMASRSLLQFLSSFSRTAVGNTATRPFSSTSVCRAALQTKDATDRATSSWTLMAAVCLQRLPVITADYSPIEERFQQLLHQVRLFSAEDCVNSDAESGNTGCSYYVIKLSHISLGYQFYLTLCNKERLTHEMLSRSLVYLSI